MSLEISGFLISTSELHSQLGNPDLRIYDCTTLLEPIEPSGLRSRSAFSFWESSHIPGSAYIDLQEDLSIHDHQYRFMCLPLEQLVTKFENLGIDDQTIVFYTIKDQTCGQHVFGGCCVQSDLATRKY